MGNTDGVAWMPLHLRITSDNRTRFGDRQTQEFAACGGTIGRSLDNDWVFPDPNRYVSGRHALIDFQAGAYYLIDTSRNGVYINDADAPVGRGHPQRIFDGDIVRIGDYIIQAAISPEVNDVSEDGMRDSVVRAQMVPEDESVELMLVDESRLVEGESLDRYLLEGEGSSRISQLNEALTGAGAHQTLQSRDIAQQAERRAVAMLLEGAGLKPGDLAGSDPDAILRMTGQILRHMVSGLTALLQERSQLTDQMRLSKNVTQNGQRNPLQLAPSVNDALKYLLGKGNKSNLAADEAVQISFLEVKNHEQAVPKALVQALKEFMDNFAPEELRQQVDQGVKRSRLLGAPNKLKYWDLFEESFMTLTHGEEGTLPEAFSQEFARAYEKEVAALRAPKTE
jgi:type VI secretion system protein ImpI